MIISKIEREIEILETSIRNVDMGALWSQIDFAAMLRLRIKALTEAEKLLTAEITRDVELTGDTEQGRNGTLLGIYFHAAITETIRWSFDSKGVKAEFGDEWYNARCKQSVVRSVKYREGVASVAQAIDQAGADFRKGNG